jgi:hypothetical protein
MKTVLSLGLLMGVLPTLAAAGIMELSLRHLGARDWPDAVAFVVFGGLFLALVGAGAYVFSRQKY